MHFENLLIGHKSLAGNTGISVLLFTQRVTCAYHLCGSAPGTRDVVPLNLGNSVEQIDARNASVRFPFTRLLAPRSSAGAPRSQTVDRRETSNARDLRGGEPGDHRDAGQCRIGAELGAARAPAAVDTLSEEVSLTVVEETAAGILLRGSRLLATL